MRESIGLSTFLLSMQISVNFKQNRNCDMSKIKLQENGEFRHVGRPVRMFLWQSIQILSGYFTPDQSGVQLAALDPNH